MSIGSLTADITSASDATVVSNITMRNIYSYQSTQMLMIKTFPGGAGAEGYVKNSVFENFWSYDCTYGLDIDQCKFSPITVSGISRLTFHQRLGVEHDTRHRSGCSLRAYIQQLDWSR